jgi:hypothetical protein
MPGATNGTNHLGVNLAFTKFIFVAPARDDEAVKARLRAAATAAGRGYFNDFEGNGTGESSPPQDSIQFLISECAGGIGCVTPRYVLQISSRYRPRLQETEQGFRRRAADCAAITALDGAVRVPQYTSAELYAYAYKNARTRESGRLPQHVIIIPIRKSAAWWQKSALERHAYFYPHQDAEQGSMAKGHACAAEAGINTIYRRLYYNPDGHGRHGEFDFITYFECTDDHLTTFEAICRDLRDVRQNPEWQFVEEGPEWRGRRVPRW